MYCSLPEVSSSSARVIGSETSFEKNAIFCSWPSSKTRKSCCWRLGTIFLFLSRTVTNKLTKFTWDLMTGPCGSCGCGGCDCWAAHGTAKARAASHRTTSRGARRVTTLSKEAMYTFPVVKVPVSQWLAKGHWPTSIRCVNRARWMRGEPVYAFAARSKAGSPERGVDRKHQKWPARARIQERARAAPCRSAAPVRAAPRRRNAVSQNDCSEAHDELTEENSASMRGAYSGGHQRAGAARAADPDPGPAAECAAAKSAASRLAKNAAPATGSAAAKAPGARAGLPGTREPGERARHRQIEQRRPGGGPREERFPRVPGQCGATHRVFHKRSRSVEHRRTGGQRSQGKRRRARRGQHPDGGGRDEPFGRSHLLPLRPVLSSGQGLCHRPGPPDHGNSADAAGHAVVGWANGRAVCQQSLDQRAFEHRRQAEYRGGHEGDRSAAHDGAG